MADPHPWKDEAESFLRAFGGAYLIGMPLLFTMEMWWIGQYTDTWKLVVFLVMVFMIDLYLAAISGFKDKHLLRSIDQAIDSVAVGLAASLIVLLVLNRITLGTPIDSIAGMVIVQAGPLSIGAAIANSIIGADVPGKEEKEEDESRAKHPPGPWRATGRMIGATVAGGLFLGLSIAPTEEIPMLAAGMTPWHELGLIGLTLVLSYLIVFESDFGRKRRPHKSFVRHPSTETLLAYALAFVVSAVALWVFERIGADDPAAWIVSQVVVLALPVSIGGAAGRLIT